jgi:hypothetical protein
MNGGRAGPVTGLTGARLVVAAVAAVLVAAVAAVLVAGVEAVLPVVCWAHDVTVAVSVTAASMATTRAIDPILVICISPAIPT